VVGRRTLLLYPVSSKAIPRRSRRGPAARRERRRAPCRPQRRRRPAAPQDARQKAAVARPPRLAAKNGAVEVPGRRRTGPARRLEGDRDREPGRLAARAASRRVDERGRAPPPNSFRNRQKSARMEFWSKVTAPAPARAPRRTSAHVERLELAAVVAPQVREERPQARVGESPRRRARGRGRLRPESNKKSQPGCPRRREALLRRQRRKGRGVQAGALVPGTRPRCRRPRTRLLRAGGSAGSKARVWTSSLSGSDVRRGGGPRPPRGGQSERRPPSRSAERGERVGGHRVPDRTPCPPVGQKRHDKVKGA